MADLLGRVWGAYFTVPTGELIVERVGLLALDPSLQISAAVRAQLCIGKLALL